MKTYSMENAKLLSFSWIINAAGPVEGGDGVAKNRKSKFNKEASRFQIMEPAGRCRRDFSEESLPFWFFTREEREVSLTATKTVRCQIRYKITILVSYDQEIVHRFIYISLYVGGFSKSLVKNVLNLANIAFIVALRAAPGGGNESGAVSRSCDAAPP